MARRATGLGAAALAALLTDQVEHPPTAEQLAETLGEALHEALVTAYETECAAPDVRAVFREVFDGFDWEPADGAARPAGSGLLSTAFRRHAG